MSCADEIFFTREMFREFLAGYLRGLLCPDHKVHPKLICCFSEAQDVSKLHRTKGVGTFARGAPHKCPGELPCLVANKEVSEGTLGLYAVTRSVSSVLLVSWDCAGGTFGLSGSKTINRLSHVKLQKNRCTISKTLPTSIDRKEANSMRAKDKGICTKRRKCSFQSYQDSGGSQWSNKNYYEMSCRTNPRQLLALILS